MNLSKLQSEAVKEKLANIEHQRWSDWQKYLHSKCIKNNDGGLTIPKESVEHWEKQINTDYKDLTEKEKDSDREQVDRYLPIIADQIQKAYSNGREEAIKQIRKMETDSYSLKGAYFNENIDFICKKLLSIQSKGK